MSASLDGKEVWLTELVEIVLNDGFPDDTFVSG